MKTVKLAIIPRIFVEPEDDKQEQRRRGRIWVCSNDGVIEQMRIESNTPRAVALEIRTYLERLVGENLETAIYTNREADSLLAYEAIKDLVPHNRVCKNAWALRTLIRSRPFERPFSGVLTRNFRAPWVEPSERLELMRSCADLDQYACPPAYDYDN